MGNIQNINSTAKRRSVNVLHTVAGLQRRNGGVSFSVSHLCEMLGEQRARVYLLSLTDRKGESDYILPDPQHAKAHFVRTPFNAGLIALSMPNFAGAITELVQQEKIQLIHDHGLWLPSNHVSTWSAKRLGIPLVVQSHGMLEPWALSYRAWKKKLAWKLYQKRDLQGAALLVATSQQEAESIRKVGLRQPIAIIPNGVDMPKFEPRGNRQEGMRTALFLSRVHPIKGLLNLVAAWSVLQPAGWRVVVAGPDENGHLREVEEAVRKVGLQKSFQFVGPVAGTVKKDMYRNADLFILPTFSENFGIVVAEALSFGIPVITTRGAPWEGLITNRCGWWVDIGIESLADAIRESTGLPDAERQEMGARGRLYAEAVFSWSRIVEEMMAVYRWILKRDDEMPCCVRLD